MLARTPDYGPKMTRAEAEAILAKYRHKPDGPFYSVSLNGWALAEITQALAALKALGLRPPSRCRALLSATSLSVCSVSFGPAIQ
jgi:hypothetical protein